MNEHLPARLSRDLPARADGWHSGHAMHYPYPSLADQNGAAPRPNRVLTFLLRYWWIPLLTTLVCAGGAGAYLYFTPPLLVSTAQMWETQKLRLPADGGGFTEDLQNYLGTQIELLRSKKLSLLAEERLRRAGTPVPVDRHGKRVEVRLRVAQAPKTAVLEIEGFSTQGAYARAFLNALMDEYLEYKKSVRKSVSGDTVASISEQALRLENELKASQEALTAFEQTNNLAIMEEEGRIAGGHLARLKTQLSDLKLQGQLLDATAQDRGPGNTNIMGVLTALPGANGPGSSTSMAERQAAVRELEVLQTQRQKLSENLRPRHPRMIKLEQDIERAQKLLQMYQLQNQEQLEQARQGLRMSVASVEESIKEWEGKVVEANSRIAEAQRLKLNMSRTQTLYDRLMMLLQNVDLSRNTDRETLAILQPATEAERYYLRDFLILAGALMAGMLAGLGLVLVVEVRDDRFASVVEIDERFGESVVGQLPEMRRLARNGPMDLIGSPDQPDMFAESCRNLRSALLFLPHEGERPKTIVITSALADEGKSTVAANLAKTLALGGARVLLVDGDIRKGHLHKALGLNASPGLMELVMDGAGPDDVLQSGSTPNLFFVARGTAQANPGDILLKPALDRWLSAWRKEFDYVLIDSCPVFAADDVTTLAHKADGTLVVVRRRYARASVVREAVVLLMRRQARVLGLVFNRADASGRSYHYYSYSDYHSSRK